MKMGFRQSVCSPAIWYQMLPGGASGGTPPDGPVRHFVAVPGQFDQPPLDAHVVALHLGGAKRVHRTQGARRWVQDVTLGSMTLMPAYQANRWHTEGPIDFAHLSLSVGTAEQIIVEEFDREPATHRLHETIGAEDPLLEQVFRAILALTERQSFGRLQMDALLTVFAVSLLERHSTAGPRATGADATGLDAIGAAPGTGRRGGLAGWQLRRVIDYMNGHMGDDMALGALAELTGLSRAHFFRAFRQSLGRSPGQFLAETRMQRARMLLETTALHPEEIASAVGYVHARHFVAAFARRFGTSPRLFRISHR